MRRFFWILGLPLRAVAAFALVLLGLVVALINYDVGKEMWADAEKVLLLGMKEPNNGRRPI